MPLICPAPSATALPLAAVPFAVDPLAVVADWAVVAGVLVAGFVAAMDTGAVVDTGRGVSDAVPELPHALSRAAAALAALATRNARREMMADVMDDMAQRLSLQSKTDTPLGDHTITDFRLFVERIRSVVENGCTRAAKQSGHEALSAAAGRFRDQASGERIRRGT